MSGVNQDEEVGFLPREKPKIESDVFRLLTKEEIIRINQKEPKWRKIRIFLLVLFVLIWLGLLLAAIGIVIVTPKCPVKPKLEFYQRKTGYSLDVMGFRDSNMDNVGDFNGVVEKIDYLKNIGAGYVIIDPINKGALSKTSSIEDFEMIEPVLGNDDDFKKFSRDLRKKGFELVISMNFNLNLNPNHNETFDKIHNVTEKWLTLGASGIILKEFSVYGDAEKNLEILRKFREIIDKINYNHGFTKFLFLECSESDQNIANYVSQGKADMILTQEQDQLYDFNMKFGSNDSVVKFFTMTPNPSSSHELFLNNLALSFLLHGSPIIRYSTELQNIIPDKKFESTTMYPFNNHGASSNFKNILLHMPMPWTNDGSHLSGEIRSSFNDYINAYGIKNSVMDAESLGRNIPAFELVKKLTKIRQLPACSFGTINEIVKLSSPDSKVFSFVRKAGTGHHDLVIAVLYKFNQVNIPIGSHCSSGNYTSLIVYPENPQIPEGHSFDSPNVYLTTSENNPDGIYVFKCDTPSL